MHARVTSVQVKPGRLEEFVNIFKEFTVPAAGHQQGFKGALLLADADQNKTFVISMWDSEANMQNAETSGYYQEQTARRATTFEGGHQCGSVTRSWSGRRPAQIPNSPTFPTTTNSPSRPAKGQHSHL